VQAFLDEPARSSGCFWHDRRERPAHRVPWTKEALVGQRTQCVEVVC